MRLPRRVPWSSLAELEQLCTWIYSDDSAHDSRRRAHDKLAAWRVATPLPHALESVLSFLAAELGDAAGASPALLVRQAYASAVVRFVNGMVDARQHGVYARSIAAIAAEIGLPGWFVELRHAATHEDLPSLEILREASREALRWLLHHYFMPTLSMQELSDRPTTQVASVEPILKSYKELAKRLLQDGSLRGSLKPELERVYAQLESWLGEVKLAAFGASGGSGDAETQEIAALEELANGLLAKGGLVPVAKKKRALADGPLAPPNAQVWSPLLARVQDQHPLFASCLLSGLVPALTGDGQEEADDLSVACLLSWIAWTLQQWADAAALDPRETIAQALISLQSSGCSSSAKTLMRLVDAVVPDDDVFRQRVAAFIQPLGSKKASWQESDVQVMKERLAKLQQQASILRPSDAARAPQDALVAPEPVAPGWRRLSAASEWKACPIGVNGLA